MRAGGVLGAPPADGDTPAMDPVLVLGVVRDAPSRTSTNGSLHRIRTEAHVVLCNSAATALPCDHAENPIACENLARAALDAGHSRQSPRQGRCR